MKPWFCLDCRQCVDLDTHGRCSHCGSDAVDVAVRPRVAIEKLGEEILCQARQ